MKYIYNPPYIIKKIFNEYYWNTVNEKVLLTYDDGPNRETTPIILEQLDRHSIKAVFFCVGENLKRYPDQAEVIFKNGHTIANHTFSHRIIGNLNPFELRSELSSFNEVYYDLFGESPKYFRPPHGRFTLNLKNVLKEFGMKNVMWSLLTYDYKNDLNIVKFAVHNFLENNSIVVMHDNIKNQSIVSDGLTVLVDCVKNKGFEFGNPSECMN
jgi:peptidoglycan/xylan/chitin deacetylase (PgdA/CDA1 family)